ncbi:MAG: hypothetical protein WCK96_02605 [Methylococcales bacterium]
MKPITSTHSLCWVSAIASTQPTRCFLQLLGLFDRPMNAAEKAVLMF